MKIFTQYYNYSSVELVNSIKGFAKKCGSVES